MANRLLILDCETGGLDCTKESILTLGAAVWVDGGINDKLDLMIAEEEIVAVPRALEVNGLKIEDIKANGVTPLQAVLALEGFMLKNDLRGKTTICGHNIAAFDMGFIKRLYNFSGLSMSKFNYHVLDTMTMAGALKFAGRINIPNLKLDTLCTYFGVDANRADGVHRAVDDAVATGHVFTKLLNLLRAMPLPNTNALGIVTADDSEVVSGSLGEYDGN